MPATDPFALLLQAYRSCQPLDVHPELGPADVPAAYAVQRALWRAMVGDSRPTAWKVGAPNRQTEPTAAAIFPQRMADSPAQFPVDDFRTLGIEAEIALRFGRDLPPRAQAYRREEILAAIASAHVAMELVDTRLSDPNAAGPLWRLADNLLNGGLVLGPEIPDWRELDFAGLSVRAVANGQSLAVTVGRPPLDDLFHCLPWWIDHVGGAKAGDMVTTGAWNGMHPVGLPTAVRVEFLAAGAAAQHVLGNASARIS